MSNRIIIYYEQQGYGGVDTHLAHLVNHWPEPKDEIIIVSNPDNEGLKFFKDCLINPSVRIEIINGVFHNGGMESSKIKRIINYFRIQFAFIINFKKLIKKTSPTILLANNGGYPGGITNFWAAIIGSLMEQTKNNTFLLVHHAPVINLRGFLPWYTGLLARWIKIREIPIITVSKASKSALQCFTPLKDLRVIYNGLEIKKSNKKPYEFKSKYNISSDKSIIGILGPIDPHKGHLFLLEIFRESYKLKQKSHLVIVGAGRKRITGDLLNTIKYYELDNSVTLTGFLSEDVDTIVSGFDILVMPTIDFEGFGYSMAEAMSSSIPVVASRVGAIPEVIIDGESGFLLPPGDKSAWVRKLEYLIDNDHIQKNIGNAGKKRIENRFSAEEMSQHYYNLLTLNENI